MENKIVVITAVNISDIGKKFQPKTREENLLRLETYEELIDAIIEKYSGKIIKTLGNHFIAAFHDPNLALQASIEIDIKLAEHNQRVVDSDSMLESYIGIDMGLVSIMDNDISGEPVNIALRIAEIAEPGQICFSDAALRKMKPDKIPYKFLGEKKFQGIVYPVKIYRMVLEPEKEETPMKIEEVVPKPVSKSGFELQEEVKIDIQKLDYSQMNKVFDFTNIEVEKRIDVESTAQKATQSASLSADILELAATSEEQTVPVKPVRSFLTDPGIEHSKELLNAIREKKYKKKNIIIISTLGTILLAGILVITYFYIQSYKEKKAAEALKKELEQSPILQSLQKPSPVVTPEEVQTLKPIESIEWAAIVIATEPKGASIWLNGKKLPFTTPAKLKKIEPNKSHHLVISKKGYKPYDVLLNLGPEETKDVEVRLTR